MDSCLPCSPEQRNNGGRWYVRMLVLAHLQSTNRAQIAFVALGTCEQRNQSRLGELVLAQLPHVERKRRWVYECVPVLQCLRNAI